MLSFKRISQTSTSEVGQYIPLLICIPCFKLSHAAFKLAYRINQRRLLRLRGQDFFLKFYDRSIATGGVVNILKTFAISNAVFKALIPANTSPTMLLPPGKRRRLIRTRLRRRDSLET
jgi:hypothetical protein